MELSPGILRLHASDNVGVCLRSMEAGEVFSIGGKQFTSPVKLTLGHKLAIQPIREGEAVIKFGVVIGTATVHIPVGSHVHTHNIRSNYIPTYSVTENKTA